MRHDQALEAISQIEESLPVDTWKENGIHFWPILRLSLFYRNADLHGPRNDEEVNLHQKPRWSWLTQYRRNVLSSIRVPSTKFGQPTAGEIVFLSNGISYAEFSGVSFDRHVDPFVWMFRQMGMKTLTLTTGESYEIPRHNETYFSEPALDRLYFFHNASGERQREIVKLHQKLTSVMDDVASASPTLKMPNLDVLIDRLQRTVLAKRLFRRMLQRVRPKLIFVVCYYRVEAMALISVCKEMDIPTFDIQHGSITRDHVAYSRWHKIPTEGYDSSPDGFCVWDERAADILKDYSDDRERKPRVIITGHAFSQYWEAELSGPESIEQQKYAKRLEGNRHEAQIVVTLQPLANEKFYRVLKRLIEELGREYFWWIRGHPTLPIRKFDLVPYFGETLQLKNVDIDLASSLPLEVLLTGSKAHLTRYSSSVLECGYFGIPSFSVDHEAVSRFKPEIDRGWLNVLNDFESLKASLRNAVRKSTRSPVQGATLGQGIGQLLRDFKLKNQ